jgi:hypothetical protein
VGLEGGVTGLFRIVLAGAVATAFVLPVQATAMAGIATKRTKIIVRPKQLWHGYGYLPGYRPTLAETNGLPVLGPDPRRKREWRYFDIYGNAHYGWGRPGFYRGQWNGGSFGPCWISTPIGMMPTCGQ